MKPIELVVVANNRTEISLFRLAASREPYPISVRVALDGPRASQMMVTKHRPTDLVILDLDFKSALSVLESIDPSLRWWCSRRHPPLLTDAWCLSLEPWTTSRNPPIRLSFSRRCLRRFGNGQQSRCMIDNRSRRNQPA
jgi:hypothetical protein